MLSFFFTRKRHWGDREKKREEKREEKRGKLQGQGIINDNMEKKNIFISDIRSLVKYCQDCFK